MNPKEITIYDIARALDVSPSTVSRGLNDNAIIGKETRKRILDTADSMGYQRNTFANRLRSKHTHTIGVVIPRVNSYFMSAVIAGMEKIVNDRGYMLIISQSQESVKRESALIHAMYNSRIDGLLVSLAADTKNLNHFSKVFRKEIPVVFFDRVADHPKCTAILIDNAKAGHDATSHLIAQGCKRIVFIGGNLNRNVYADRLKGFKLALQESGLVCDPACVFIDDLTERAGREAAARILTMNPLPDGIFASNDTSAVACVGALKEAGITIPGQVAVVGFNNDPISKVVAPGLTTIAYPGYEIGETAATYIINAISERSTGTFNSVVLRHELIIRESSVKQNMG